MELFRARYMDTALCDVCGEWFRTVVELEPGINCTRCDCPMDGVLICKSCLQEALKLIEEENDE